MPVCRDVCSDSQITGFPCSENSCLMPVCVDVCALIVNYRFYLLLTQLTRQRSHSLETSPLVTGFQRPFDRVMLSRVYVTAGPMQ